jgi:chromosomal replication initiation ATPase DnaA
MMTIGQCVALVARVHGMDPGRIMFKVRRKEISHPRQTAMLLAVEQGHSKSRVARFFGMDHTSVLYGARQAEKRRKTILERMDHGRT